MRPLAIQEMKQMEDVDCMEKKKRKEKTLAIKLSKENSALTSHRPAE